jgi:hypothetical protein
MRPQRHHIVCHPNAGPPLRYLLGALAQSHGHALIEIDRDLTDAYGRVLGYAYASDPSAAMASARRATPHVRGERDALLARVLRDALVEEVMES